VRREGIWEKTVDDEEGSENCGLDVVLVEADRLFSVAEK
jgi:hypothetical protein